MLRSLLLRSLTRPALQQTRARFATPRAVHCRPSAGVHSTPRAQFSTKPIFKTKDEVTLLMLQASTRDSSLRFLLAFTLAMQLANGVDFLAKRNRKRPTNLQRETLKVLADHTDVVQRLGVPLTKCEGSGIDVARLNDADDAVHIRIKFDVEGPHGRATVVVQVTDSKEDEEFEYLAVTFADAGDELQIFDTRPRSLDASEDPQKFVDQYC